MSTAKDKEGRKRLTLAKNWPWFSSLNAVPLCKNPSNFDLNNFSGRNSLDILVLLGKESYQVSTSHNFKNSGTAAKIPF